MTLKYPQLIGVCIILTVIFTGKQIVSELSQNLATVTLYKTLSEDNVNAAKRQHALFLAAKQLKMRSQEGFIVSHTPKTFPMIPAILRGEHHRRLEDYSNAADWYNVAAESVPYPTIQKAILVPSWAKITSEGAIVLDGSAGGWRVRSDTIPEATIRQQNRTGIFSILNSSMQGKRAAFSWDRPLYIPYHHTVVLKARIQKDALFSFETVIDEDLVRHLNKYRGIGRWEEFVFTVEGDHLRYIYILLDRPTPTSTTTTDYVVAIESISFVLDENTYIDN